MSEHTSERQPDFELRDQDVAVNGVVFATHASRVRGGVALPPREPLTVGDAQVYAEPTWRRAGVQLVIDREGVRTVVLTGALESHCVPCDVLALDTRYALPVFRWPSRDALLDELRVWTQLNADAGRAALLGAEPTDEALQILELLGPEREEVLVHPALVDSAAEARAGGRALAPTAAVPARGLAKHAAGRLVLAPPSELRDPTLKLGPHESALASGRMRVRGGRRRLAIDRGFVLSSRADWPTLVRAVEESGAREVLTFGAQADHFARWLREQGRKARELAT